MNTDQPEPSEYQEEPTTHAGAALAADFAVKERSRNTRAQIELREVVKAESQQSWRPHGSPGATSWRLRLEVTAEDGKSSFVEATVLVDVYSNHKLTSWVESTR